jgi:hypothetical protein
LINDGGQTTLDVPDLFTPPGFKTGKVPLAEGRTIVLDANYSYPFHRREGTIQGNGFAVKLKPVPTANPAPLPLTPLARYLYNNFVD